jgi:anti-anti-sigma factor
MKLLLESRPVGEVLVIQCQGRIVSGNEVLRLHAYVGDFIAKYGDVVLQLEQIEFIDSSGLGALMRLLQAARSKKGDLKLCRLPSNIRKMLEITHLLPQFETYESVEEAITAAYLGSHYSPGKAGDTRPLILCIYESSDVCTFLREVLCSAGYNALTTLNINDAKILLKATKAKVVLVSAGMQSFCGKATRQMLQEIAPSISLIVLDDNFAAQDPAEAAEKLLSEVHEITMAGKA